MKEISITVRFPPDLHAAIKQRATNDRRSFNGEVIWELEQYRTAAPVPKMNKIPISREDLQQDIPAIEEVWKRYS